MPHSTYLPHRMGTATIDPTGHFEAGSFQSFTLTYTAGYFGIDDTGSIKIVHRFASDMGKPQFDDPAAPNYVSAEASNGAVLDVRYDGKMNIRPWDKTLYIKVVRGFLREGTGSSCVSATRGRALRECGCRPFVNRPSSSGCWSTPSPPTTTSSCRCSRRLPSFPPAVRWQAILPTERVSGERFRLCLKGEDPWGNPSDQCDLTASLRSNAAVAGLPETVQFTPGEFSVVVDGLSVDTPGDLRNRDARPRRRRTRALEPAAHLGVDDPEAVLGRSARPVRGDHRDQLRPRILRLRRDRAFLDVCSHQGNDFQITTPFWNHLNDLTTEFNADGQFIAFPGYEWSGNTGLGGDRNVLFLAEGRQIHRSSHALVDDLSDVETDANSAQDLFEALKDEDCVVFAHIGGRYADIKMSHDARIERAVEVHSAWGTFEWLVQDAMEQGYRVGICSNSDGHKGRPGASYPGATSFGAYARPDLPAGEGPHAPGAGGLLSGASLLRHHRLPNAPRHPRAVRQRRGALCR